MIKSYLVFVVLLWVNLIGFAQEETVVMASSSDISDNLDLEAVASLFGEVNNLEEFERKLNDPKSKISNLDLNNDGQVDYLRVVEKAGDSTHVVTIQAIIGKDEFQDVATIDVEKNQDNVTQVQVIGDEFLYGSGYIIEPVYYRTPVIFVYFWDPFFIPWYSPYYWGFYPPYWVYWHPYPAYVYRQNVVVYINSSNRYRYPRSRRSIHAQRLQHTIRRTDYSSKHPSESFLERNKGVSNRLELVQRRNAIENREKGVITTDKKVDGDWKSKTKREERNDVRKNQKVIVPPKQEPQTGKEEKPVIIRKQKSEQIPRRDAPVPRPIEKTIPKKAPQPVVKPVPKRPPKPVVKPAPKRPVKPVKDLQG